MAYMNGTDVCVAVRRSATFTKRLKLLSTAAPRRRSRHEGTEAWGDRDQALSSDRAQASLVRYLWRLDVGRGGQRCVPTPRAVSQGRMQEAESRDDPAQDSAMKARRYRPRTGPGNSKEGYRDFSGPKPERVLKAYCTCPSGDAMFAAGVGRPCLITGHVNKALRRVETLHCT